VKLFIDTGSVAEVEEIAAWGVLSGATTNPSLLAKEEGDPASDWQSRPEFADWLRGLVLGRGGRAAVTPHRGAAAQ
jgi:hypothetical protein